MIEQTKKEPTEFTEGQTNNKHIAQRANKKNKKLIKSKNVKIAKTDKAINNQQKEVCDPQTK